MSNTTTVKQRLVPGVLFAMLSMVAGIASCGGGSGATPRAAPINTPNTPAVLTTLFAAANPDLVADSSPAQTAVITWSSTDSTSCSSSPSGITGTSGSFTTPSLSATTTYTITCDGPTGQKSKRVTIARAPAAIVTAITDQQTACAAEVVRGTSYYYCDCGRGAASNCVAGDDTNAGTNPAAPRRTIANAISRLATLTGTNSLRFCKGGAFDAATSLNMPNMTCALGSTCTDFREYDPPALPATTAKPILNSATGGVQLFNISGNKGGIRLLNLELRGNGSNGNVGMFLYSGAHDITACNIGIDGFRLGVQQVPGITTATATIPAVTNVTLTGINFSNNIASAYLGSGTTTEISKNKLLNNGSGNMFDHTVYLSAANLVTPNMRVNENLIFGQVGDTCLGTVIVAHGKLPGLTIQKNVLAIDEAADTMGCYGIGLDHGGYNTYTDFSSAVISANTLSNTGGIGIVVANCADCLIENNLLSFNAAESYGISAGEYAARTICPNGAACPDVVNNRNKITNNTIWFGPNATNGLNAGIQIKNEGTGHVVANNTVNYMAATSTGHTVNCFDYTQPLTSYSFVDNNHCYSAVPYRWDKTNGADLAAWRTYSTNGGHPYDTASITVTPAFVNTTTFPYDFHTDAASLLQNSGTGLHMPGTDITGAPFIAPHDIGAYE